MLFLLWISLFSSSFGGLDADSCKEADYGKCLLEAKFDRDFNYYISKEEFKKTCKEKMKDVKCVRDYKKKCSIVPDVDVPYLPSLQDDNLNIVELLCSGGATYDTGLTGILERLSCWETLKEDFAYCDSKFKESQEEIQEDNLEPPMKVLHSCCAFDWVKRCKTASVELRCDEEYKTKTQMNLPLNIMKIRKRTDVCDTIFSRPNANCSDPYGVEVEDLKTKFSRGTSLPPSFVIPFLCFMLIKIKNYL